MIDTQSLHEASLRTDRNEFVRDLMKKVTDFRLECYIILCGFDENGNAFMVNVDDPGEATNYSRVGYHAVGSGWNYALARLACWSDIKRSMPIDQALFAVLDAKISAETNPFIGGDWNALVVMRGQCIEVPKELMEMLDKAWVKHNRSPYWKRSSDDLNDPPRDWKRRVEDWSTSIRPSAT